MSGIHPEPQHRSNAFERALFGFSIGRRTALESVHHSAERQRGGS